MPINKTLILSALYVPKFCLSFFLLLSLIYPQLCIFFYISIYMGKEMKVWYSHILFLFLSRGEDSTAELYPQEDGYK